MNDDDDDDDQPERSNDNTAKWVVGGGLALLALLLLGRGLGKSKGSGKGGGSGSGGSGSGSGSSSPIIKIGVYGCALNNGSPGPCSDLCKRIGQGELDGASEVALVSTQGSHTDVSNVIDCLSARGIKYSLEK